MKFMHTIPPCAALCLAAASAIASTDAILTIAITGQPAPGAPAGTSFSSLEAVELNERGDILFFSNLLGPNTSFNNDRGLFLFEASNFHLLALEGDPAPGTPLTFSGLDVGIPVLNNAGTVAFRAAVFDPINATDAGFGIWVGGPDALVPVARSGQRAPGTPSTVLYTLISPPSLDDSGRLAFIADLTGQNLPDTQNSGVWAGTPNAIARAQLESDPAPGLNGLRYTGFLRVDTRGTGQLSLSARVDAPSFAADAGLWTGQPGQLSLVAREGDPAPGADPAVFAVVGVAPFPLLTDSGTSILTTTLAGPTITFGNDLGIWTGTPGNLTLLAREGNPAPTGTPGVTFRDIEEPAVNAAGDLAFLSLLAGQGITGTNLSSLWLARPQGLTLAAQSGRRAPGTPPGVTFDAFFQPAINANAQLAFRAFLTGPGITSANDLSLWATDPQGRPQLILQEGQTLDLNPDPRANDLRTVAGAILFERFSGPNDRDRLFNAAGQLLLIAQFTDGSQALLLADTRLLTPCPADLTGDGLANIFDILDFFNAFAAGDPLAERDGQPGFNIFDILAYLNAFADGCN